jgi:dihydrofolate synthase/folylpolyglutamate synthase
MLSDQHKPKDIESWLEQLGQPSADRDYKPGHQRIRDLLAFSKLKQPKLRIRIAGTNGKGSTAFMLAYALQACGLKVGLYTSPHIHQFNERIRINGTPIDSAELLALIEEIMPTALEIGASYFEVATALALKHFSNESVDVEILEAGVGARLDATTAVPANMALITPIGIDHQAWLGDTLTEIAQEKAHVGDSCRRVISAGQTFAVASILVQHSPSIEIAEDADFSNLKTIGNHQQQNASLAWSAVQSLASDDFINPDMLDKARIAIEQTYVPGRLQREPVEGATIWLDAAHNAHAVETLLPTLCTLATPFDAIMIFTREDRNLSDCIKLLKPLAKQIVGDDKHHCEKSYATVDEALDAELRKHPNGKFLILGSFITVAAALEWISSKHPEKS